jgi:predicted transcriptional regulator
MNKKKTPIRSATKKTIKKAAKKTYTPAKKTTVPKLRFATLEELAVFMAENHAKTEAAIRGLSAENRKTTETLKETLRSVEKMSNKVESLSGNLGGVNNRLGIITELIVVPKLRHNMNALGHNFDRSNPDMKIRGVIAGRKEDIAQVDMLLRGPTEVLAVEVKTRLRELHVREHLERLQDLRDHEDDAGIKDKKLFGAVAGVAIDDNAKKIAKENGLYIVKIHEEEGKLDIEKPETCRPW